jgi:hypothetical protein
MRLLAGAAWAAGVFKPSQCSCSPHHQKRNGIHGPYERPPSATTLETRFWQRSRAPFSRHSGQSWNRHMFLYQITYGKIVCNCKPDKKEKEQVRLIVGSDRLDYSGNVMTSTTDITTFKIEINSTISTTYASMMMMDIKNFYLEIL